MQDRPGITNVFLDLQAAYDMAAYDMVDRRILWHHLRHTYGATAATIRRLKGLFDHNRSVLLVAGKRSGDIRNTRGLLQGSSLSPILFNFFINQLCRRLQEPEMPKVWTGRDFDTNNLFFADDCNLHANTPEDMRTLLQTVLAEDRGGCQNTSREQNDSKTRSLDMCVVRHLCLPFNINTAKLGTDSQLVLIMGGRVGEVGRQASPDVK